MVMKAEKIKLSFDRLFNDDTDKRIFAHRNVYVT